ncbi:phage tail protein [Methanosarcina sp. UBA5]|uniref:phage tail protein n=1 Tax=Methanosarcina sp. UBA5 TaxID=1915593 RepID=UPI0025DA1380|nr:phage tail protein [Methanosarcina sp. UBA5]
MPRQDPYRQFRFRVEIGSIKLGFSECTFADTTTDPVEYREGDELPIFRKLSGLTKYGNITLKWGITDNMELFNWRQQIIDKGAENNRKDMSIILINEAGEDKARWEITRAWPSKYDPVDFNAKGNEVAIETLEIVHEGFKRVS